MSKRVKHANSVSELLTEDPDVERIHAKKKRLLKKLEEMGERFVSYHKYLDEIIAEGGQAPGDIADQEPTHLQHLLQRVIDSPWHKK